MTDHYDALETRAPAEREAELFSRLPDVLRKAMAAPAYAERLEGIDPAGVTSRAALAGLPVLRKSDLPPCTKPRRRSAASSRGVPGSFGRLFTSPGPIFEPEPAHADPWRGARALFAARFPPGRRGAEHLQLSSDARRLHLRRLGARARLRGDSGRSRQYRGAIRADRGVSSGRLQRHPRFPQNPARCGLQTPAATSPRSSAPWFPARRSRSRCRTRSNLAASMPIRRSAPPISA